MARPRAATAKSGALVKSRHRATSTVAARRAVLKRIRDEGVEHVLFWFTDIEGHCKSFAITQQGDEDPFVAARDAFDAAKRLLDSELDTTRGFVKQH